MIEAELEKLLAAAKADENLRNQLVEIYRGENPVDGFCALCQSLGYSVTAGELFTSGQTESDAKLRSVNGGGVNAIDGWDDEFEQFFARLLWT